MLMSKARNGPSSADLVPWLRWSLDLHHSRPRISRATGTSEPKCPQDSAFRASLALLNHGVGGFGLFRRCVRRVLSQKNPCYPGDTLLVVGICGGCNCTSCDNGPFTFKHSNSLSASIYEP